MSARAAQKNKCLSSPTLFTTFFCILCFTLVVSCKSFVHVTPPRRGSKEASFLLNSMNFFQCEEAMSHY